MANGTSGTISTTVDNVNRNICSSIIKDTTHGDAGLDGLVNRESNHRQLPLRPGMRASLPGSPTWPEPRHRAVPQRRNPEGRARLLNGVLLPRHDGPWSKPEIREATRSAPPKGVVPRGRVGASGQRRRLPPVRIRFLRRTTSRWRTPPPTPPSSSDGRESFGNGAPQVA